MQPRVTSFFHRPTYTITHVVAELSGNKSVIIDPVVDFAPNSCRTSTEAADEVLAFVRDQGLEVEWILETHAHADHLTAAPYLKDKLGARVGIGAQITKVQATFKTLFNAGGDFVPDGKQFDHLFEDGERFRVGEMEFRVMHTPGHTPACVTYVVGDAAFVGDTLFMPDYGTARADFPGGDARTLYRSIKRLLALPPETRLFMCHDYKAPGRDEYAWETTVADERAHNAHVKEGISEDDFVAMREARDATLAAPHLLMPSIQVNMRAGHLPPPDANGVQYLKIPVKLSA
jgi:glyoxylase-like metal-dependent hydrolase (beta-lactamase superfamily II)